MKDAKVFGQFFVCLVLFVGIIFNSPWIISNLIFSQTNSTCVTTFPEGFTINLSIWLQVDAYVRISLLLSLLVVVVLYFCNYRGDLMIMIKSSVGLMLAFTSVWGIVGSVLFWKHLNWEGLCEGGLQLYMFIFLIF